MKKIFITFVLFALGFLLKAQAPLTPETFPAEIDRLFNGIEIKNKQTNYEFNGMEYATLIKGKFTGTTLTSGEKSALASLMGQLVKKRLQAHPELKNFLDIAFEFAEQKKSRGEFTRWLGILSRLAKEPRIQPLQNFLEATQTFISQNIININRDVVWSVTSEKFTLPADSLPYFRFDITDLRCAINGVGDQITQTSGKWYPLDKKWEGTDGKVNWKRVGLDPDSVFAELTKYTIPLQSTQFQADSALFRHVLIKEAFVGRFEDNYRDTRMQESPRFTSYSKNVKFENFVPGVDYFGGIGIQAKKMIMTGDRNQAARFEIKGAAGGKAIIKSNDFVLSSRYISTVEGEAILRVGNDSIYHPSIVASYDIESKTLTLSQGRNLLSKSPFFDSYHQIEIDAPAVIWNMATGNFVVKKGTGLVKENDAVFTSADNYSPQLYRQIQGYDQVNPLNMVYGLVGKKKGGIFTVAELASFMNMTQEQARMFAIRLASEGFLNYQFLTDRIKAQPKLRHYIEASASKRDFDQITILSKGASTNAALDVNKMTMRIYAADTVALSYSKRVAMFPASRTITMEKNRDMLFTGAFYGGLFRFFASDTSRFNYEAFNIDAPAIDSLQMWVLDPQYVDGYGNPMMGQVNSVVENVTGLMQIDHKNNKSGLNKKYPGYPQFETDTSLSYVYYQRGRYGKEYKREKFYYTVFPFKIKSLNNILKDSVILKGFLTTSGIFPVLKNPLEIRPDFSLGFQMNTGQLGLMTYLEGKGSKGKLTGKIDLSNSGLRGDGRLNYLSSVSLTDTTQISDTTDFIFFPEHMIGQALSFDVPATATGVQYPKTTGRNVKQKWMPWKNVLEVLSIRTPIQLFENQLALTGKVKYGPDGMRGEGTAAFDRAEMESFSYTFRHHEFTTDTSDFRIKTKDKTALAFVANNYKSHFDFQKRFGTFNSNMQGSVIKFPFNQYTSTIPDFTWDMNQTRLDLTSKGYSALNQQLKKLSPRQLIDGDFTGEFVGPQFTSTHPGQHQLSFMGFAATFDLEKSIINISDVRYIKVADAALIVPDGKVTIEAGAKMQPFSGAILITKHDTLHHQLSGVDARIASKKFLSGKGTFLYTDGKSLKNKVVMHKLQTDSTRLVTLANTRVGDTSVFKLSRAFDFKGEVNFDASQPFLRFNGQVALPLVSHCDGMKNNWIMTDTLIDPRAVTISIGTTLRNGGGDRIKAAIMMPKNAGRFYPAFLQPSALSDVEVLAAQGGMIYSDGTYAIASPQVLRNRSLPGNLLILDSANCLVKGIGKIDLNFQFVPTFKIRLAGEFAAQTKEGGNQQIKGLMLLDYPLMKAASEILTKAFEDAQVSSASIANDQYQKPLADLLGTSEAQKIRFELQTKDKKPTESLKTATLITGLDLKWESNTSSFNSVGPAGVIMLNGKAINKMVKVYLQIVKRANQNEDNVKVLFWFGETDYYYFEFGRGSVMSWASTNVAYNAKVTEEAEAFNKKIGKENPDSKWKSFKMSSAPVNEALKFKADMDAKSL